MTGCRVIIAILVLATSTLGASAQTSSEPDIKLGEFIPAATSQPAPEMSFDGLDGKPVALADFKGRLVILNLWATWCQPCLKEMPSLDRLQSELHDTLLVAAISEDHGGATRVGPFVAAMGLQKLKIYLDPKSDVGHAFNVRGLPTSIVIDARGRVVGRVEGAAEWDSAAMMAVLKPFLESGPGVIRATIRDAAR